MSYRVKILAAATEDIDETFSWITERSAAGAERWYEALQAGLDELRRDPEAFPSGFRVRSA